MSTWTTTSSSQTKQGFSSRRQYSTGKVAYQLHVFRSNTQCLNDVSPDYLTEILSWCDSTLTMPFIMALTLAATTIQRSAGLQNQGRKTEAIVICYSRCCCVSSASLSVMPSLLGEGARHHSKAQTATKNVMLTS